jgi:hypothetical protein
MPLSSMSWTTLIIFIATLFQLRRRSLVLRIGTSLVGYGSCQTRCNLDLRFNEPKIFALGATAGNYPSRTKPDEPGCVVIPPNGYSPSKVGRDNPINLPPRSGFLLIPYTSNRWWIARVEATTFKYRSYPAIMSTREMMAGTFSK